MTLKWQNILTAHPALAPYLTAAIHQAAAQGPAKEAFSPLAEPHCR